MESIGHLLRKESSDEEKFVALMIIPKYVNINDTEAVASVFSKIDFDFVERLLLTEVSQEEISADVIRMVAIRIISCFASFSQFAASNELQGLLKKMIESVEFFEIYTYHTFDWLTISEMNDKASKTDALVSLAITISNIIASSETFELDLYHIELVSRLFKLLPKEHSENMILLFQRLLIICTDKSSAILHILSKIFMETNDSLKFKLLDFFVHYLSSNTNIKKDESWIQPLKIGVNIIIQNKINPQQTNSVLTLVSILIRFLGAKEFFQVPASNMTVLKFHKFLALILHVICAEVRVLVDDYKIPSEESFIVEVDETGTCVLPLCLESLDYIVFYISNGEFEDSNLDVDILMSIRGTLTEAFLSIASFLDEIYSHFILQNNNFSIIDNLNVFFAIRALSTWYAEESSVSRNELIQLLPLLILSCQHRFSCISENVIEFIGPAFENITSDLDVAVAFTAGKGHDTLCKFLSSSYKTCSLDVTASLTIVLTNLALHVPTVCSESLFFETAQILFQYFFDSALLSDLSFASNLVVLILECSSRNVKALSETHINNYFEKVRVYLEFVLRIDSLLSMLKNSESDFKRLFMNVISALMRLESDFKEFSQYFDVIIHQLNSLDIPKNIKLLGSRYITNK